ncbi:hypothetical protein ACFPH6_38965 [Streptomyces xiangluensis]|uniref:Peptidase inhibitor family I36 n=1 Tax=Streptomyces xiangluensis TaxID=2665720 RepID=A0ABV8Z066_9ACTN
MGMAPPASAATVYVSDECTSSGNARCMTLFYNSQAGAIFASSCFISNRNLDNFSGNYGEGTTYVYVFDARDLITNNLGYCSNGSGSGQPVKNNAAAGSNSLSSNTVRIYYNSGHAGPYQSFAPGSIKNLNSTLKNQNASQELV